MRIIAEEGLFLGWTIHSFKRGERSACFVIKATGQLQESAESILAIDAEPISGDKYRDDDLTKSLLYPTDVSPLKPRADIVVLATAYAPGNLPVPRLSVRIKVGPVDKRLIVFGPRAWLGDLSDRRSATEPQPFVSVPIAYENAFGGVNSRKNPVGRGIDSDDLPRIEDPRRLVTSARDIIDPAGFGPVAASWQPRADSIGTYDERWLVERWPWFPENFDYGHFNAAPRDQQIAGYLKGNEELQFENLHAQHATYRSRLPGRRARCFLQERDTNGQPGFREVSLNLDTLWIDLDAEKMVLVWRGHVPVRTIKLKEIDQILAWTEPLSEPPRLASYCPILLAERQRAEDAEFEVESPEEAAEAAARKAAADEDFEKAFADFDKEMAAGEKEIEGAEAAAELRFAEERARLIAAGIDPALLKPKPEQAPADALRAAILHLQGSNPEQAADLEKNLAEVERLDAEFADMEEEFAAQLPPEPTRDDVLAAIARGESLAGEDLNEMDLTGQNLTGIDFRGASLRKAVLKKANLQKANLAEADLSQADLSDADLTQAVLDGADLTGANFAGTKLSGLSLRGTDMSGHNLSGADFSGSFGKNADFSGSDLTKARFIGAKLPFADFSNCKLLGADFRMAELGRADLDDVQAAGINLEGAELTGASATRADLTGGNFKRVRAAGAVFSEAMMDRADFSMASLTRVQFSSASLQGAVFDRADLSSASFDGAILRRARLTHANLIRALFDQADLTEADVSGSNLYEAGLWEAVLDRADFRNANVKGTTLA